MMSEIDERRIDDVWILYDTGSAMTVCLHRFPKKELGTNDDNGGPRCEAAFRVASVAKPIVSAEGLFQAGWSIVIPKIGWCFVITPQRSDNRVASATGNVVAERKNQHRWRLGSVDHIRSENESRSARTPSCRPGDEQAPKAASSSNRRVLPMLETRPELQENRGGRELLRETDGDALEVSTKAVAPNAPSHAATGGASEAQNWRTFHFAIGVFSVRLVKDARQVTGSE